jgi:predicted alpha/beta hydrolase
MIEPVRIAARHDGFALGGELFLPEGPPGAAALIAPAMAVRARFYAPFAGYLAEQGVAALTLDYRGIGSSRPSGPLREFSASFHDWAERDLGGGLDLLAQRFAGLPLHWVGHSAGGQLMGLLPGAPVRSALFVASQHGYWKNWSGLGRAAMAAFWYGLLPASTALAGYLPMRAFRQGENVPAGVAREWAQWGRHPRYIGSYAAPRGGLGFASYRGPLRSLALADDPYAPVKSVEELLALYTGARTELRVLRPNGSPIGHFGFFKQPALWEEEVRWLLAAG